MHQTHHIMLSDIREQYLYCWPSIQERINHVRDMTLDVRRDVNKAKLQ